MLLLALIDCTPWGTALFGTAPLGAGMLLLEELRKVMVRRIARSGAAESAAQ